MKCPICNKDLKEEQPTPEDPLVFKCEVCKKEFSLDELKEYKNLSIEKKLSDIIEIIGSYVDGLNQLNERVKDIERFMWH